MDWTVRKIRRGFRDLRFHVGEPYKRGLSDKGYIGFSDGEWDHEGDDSFARHVAGEEWVRQRYLLLMVKENTACNFISSKKMMNHPH